MDVGEKVEDFKAPDETGKQISLSGLLESGPVVLFFYPAALTPGCTAESCHFRDLKSEFDELGAQPVGISHDTVERQAEFSSAHSLGYPLLSDADHKIAKQFGTKRVGVPWSRRMTFVIDSDGTVLAALRDEVNMDAHADMALEALRSKG